MLKGTLRKLAAALTVCAMIASSFALQGASANSEARDAAGTWIYKGTPQLAAKGTGAQLSTSDSGTSYLLYKDGGTTGQVAVKKFAGDDWVSVGGGYIPDARSSFAKLALSGDTPYVAYNQSSTRGYIYVKKLENDEWVDVGGYIEGYYSDFDFTVSDGVPYIAFTNSTSTGTLTVMKYSEEAGWSAVGGGNVLGEDKASIPALLVADGKPYVAFLDNASASKNKISVMSYNDSAGQWEAVGSRGFSESSVSGISIAKTGTGDKLFVSFVINKAARVMSFTEGESTEWEQVGNLDIGLYAHNVDLYADDQQTPIIAYQWVDTTTSIRYANVKRFDSGEWLDVSDTPVAGTVPSLTFYNGVPSFAFVEDKTTTGPISVMELNKAVSFRLTGVAKDTKIDLSWAAVGGSVSYSVYRSDSGDEFGELPEAVVGGDTTTYRSTKLVNGQTYRYYVEAQTPNGSVFSNEVSFTPQPYIPAVPQQLTARAVGGGMIDWQWSPVSDLNGSMSDPDGYRLYLVNDDGARTLLADGIIGTEYIGTGMENGVIGHYGVSAYNANGESEISATALAVAAQSVWEPLGSDNGISVGRGTDNSLFVYDGVPYIAYQDQGLGNSITVMKYTEAGWAAVGQPGFSGAAGDASLFVYEGTPYVSMHDSLYGGGLSVMKYTGEGATGWEPVGRRNITGSYINETSLFIDQGIIYVAFNETRYNDAGAITGTFVKAVKYSDDGWSDIGDYTAEQGNNGGNNMSLFVYQGTPYAGYRSKDLSGEVIRFNGEQWELLGGKNFTANEGTTIRWSSLYVYDGIPYLGYSMNSAANLSRYDGEKWEYVGSKGFYQPGAWLTKMTFSEDGTPYMLFADQKNGDKAVVMKYTGEGDTGWELVGNQLFSAGIVEYTSLAVDNGKVYVAFADGGNQGKTTVMAFDDSVPSDTPAETPTGTSGGSPTAANNGKIADGVLVLEPQGSELAMTATLTEQQLGKMLQTASSGQLVVQTGTQDGGPLESLSITLPLQSIREAADQVSRLSVINGSVTLTLDLAELLDGVSADAKSLTVNIGIADGISLSDAAARKLGTSSVWNVQATAGDQPLTRSANAKLATLSLPYTLTGGDQAHQVVAYTTTDGDSLNAVRGTHYDSAAGIVTVPITAWGVYGAGYADATFTDLSQAKWAQTAVEALAARDIINGVGDDAFAPNDQVTRAQFLHLLMNALSLASDGAGNSFTDVAAGAWYTDSVAAAAALGIASGRSDGSFGPNDAITREDMAVLLYRAAAIAGIEWGDNDQAVFTDASSISSYASEAVNALYSSGIIKGMSDGSMNPKSNASRAQAAAIIYALLKQMGQV